MRHPDTVIRSYLEGAYKSLLEDIYSTNSKTQSCCGKTGIDKWDNQSNQWKCSECGGVKSNDPNYLYGYKSPYWSPSNSNGGNVAEVKCVCGAQKAKTTHATWCDVKN